MKPPPGIAEAIRRQTALHEAAHAIAAQASRWYVGQYIELEPQDRPDLAGLHRSIRRPLSMERPYQKLELGIGGFIVAVAGWLSESLWPQAEFQKYAAPIEWGWFLDEAGTDSDGEDAERSLLMCSEVLGLPNPTRGMYTEAWAAAVETMRHPLVQRAIEQLGADLLKSGRVGDLGRYWPHEPLDIVDRTAAKWSRRFGHRNPEAAALLAEGRWSERNPQPRKK